MKQFIKRSIALIMSVCMIVGLLCCEAFAENTSFNTAKSISTNTFYSGNIYSYGDNNYYRFTLTQAGYITFDFQHEYVDASYTYWEAYLYNADCDEITQLGRYVGNTKATITSTKIGLPAGTYYVMVDNDYLSDVSYSLKVNFTASTIWENEPSNSFDDALKIKTGTTYCGSIMNYDDKDCYRFTLNEKGYITFNFQHEYVDASYAYWEAYLYNADCDEITQLGRYVGNTKATITSTKIGLPAGTYYVMVDNDYLSDVPYKLKVNFTASSVWETEMNDSFDTADTMKFNSYINGSISGIWGYESDYYKIKVPETQYVKLCFKHAAFDDSSTYWNVSIYDKNCDSLDLNYYIQGNDASFSSDKIKLKAGTYYIKVADNWYSDVPYSIKLKTYVATPTVSEVTNSSGSIKVKWSKVSSADGYKVYRKKSSGDWTLVKTITSNDTINYTDKDVNNGTKYQYRIRAYNDVNGTKVYSSYSGTKTIYRLSQPTISSASNSGAKKITVKWKENTKATGYQVKYVVGSTTKTVKTTNLSKTISDLKKGSTYKVYVRAYKTVGGHTYYSAYSSYKSVKVTK